MGTQRSRWEPGGSKGWSSSNSVSWWFWFPGTRPGQVYFFLMFFRSFSAPPFLQPFVDFGTSLGTHFRTFWHHFYTLLLMSVLYWFFIDLWSDFVCFFYDFSNCFNIRLEMWSLLK